MRNLGIVALGAVLAGCASSSAEITPAYISPVMHQQLTCPQLAQEAQGISARAASLSGVQDQKRTRWEDVAEPNESVVSSGVTLFDDFIHANYQPVQTFGNITVLQAKEG
jgi:hypothetical protein